MAVNSTLLVTPETLKFRNPIASRFFKFYEEFKKSGKSFSPTDILGPCPIIPNTHDTDARIKAYEEQIEYAKKYQEMEERIRIITKKEA